MRKDVFVSLDEVVETNDARERRRTQLLELYVKHCSFPSGGEEFVTLIDGMLQYNFNWE